MIHNLVIAKITPNDDFTIDIKLTNGKSFVFDIKPYLNGRGLKKLRSISFFKQVKFKGELLYWDDMHDFPLHCMNLPDELIASYPLSL